MSAKTRDVWSLRTAFDAAPPRDVLDALADSVLVVDADGRIVEINQAAEGLLGAGSADVAGRSLPDVLPELAPLMPAETLLERSRAQGGMSVEVADGRRSAVPVHVAVSAREFDGRQLYLLTIRDFRRVALAQQQLLRTERLAAIGATMTALAHESRNALQRMQSCLTLIKLRGNAPVLELVDDMQDAQDQLQRLYEEVRGFAAPLKLEQRPTDLRKLVARVWRQLGLRWRAREIGWELEASQTAETSADVDPEWMGEALRNVLENAIDASPDQGIVRCTVSGVDDSDPAVVEIAIEDSGPGVPEESRERVFDLLYTTKQNGTGMGLAIAQRIVCEHFGEVCIENGTRTDGARVVIRIPRQAAA